MMDEIPALDKQGLRKFGLTTGVIIVILFVAFFPWLFESPELPVWPWVLAAALWVPALLFPLVLRPVYKGWMKVGLVLGWVNTRIILGILFYLLIFPIGLMLRLAGKDPLARKFDETARSYRKKSEDIDRDRLEKPF